MSAQIGAQFLEKTKVVRYFTCGRSRGKTRQSNNHRRWSSWYKRAKIAVGLGADVTIIDLSAERLRQLDDIFGNQVKH